jgi:hypothetical protein
MWMQGRASHQTRAGPARLIDHRRRFVAYRHDLQDETIELHPGSPPYERIVAEAIALPMAPGI